MKKINWLGCTANALQLVIEKAVKPAEILIARAKHYVECLKQNEFLEDDEEKIVSIISIIKPFLRTCINNFNINRILQNFLQSFFCKIFRIPL
jgi:hypothetical protein